MLNNVYVPNNSAGEPAKELHLPVGIDPSKQSCGVAIIHPEAGNDVVLKSFEIDNRSLDGAMALKREAETIAQGFGTEPIYIIEATNVFWRPPFSYLKRSGRPVHTVCSPQTYANRKTKMRKTQTDKIDAKFIAKLHKQGQSHPTKFPEEPLMSLRELTRLHSFLCDLRGSIHNRQAMICFRIHPESASRLSDLFGKTAQTLMEKELVHPETLSQISLNRLTRVLKKASHGRFGEEKASELKESAAKSFGMPEAKFGLSRCLKALAQSARHLDQIINPLEEVIEEFLSKVPQQLETLPGLGAIGAAHFVSELGDPKDFKNADQVVAWFGLDPILRQSGKNPGSGHHISEAGSSHGRKALFIATTEFVCHVEKAKRKCLRLVKHQGKHHINALTIITADVAKICFAMYGDNKPFDESGYN